MQLRQSKFVGTIEDDGVGVGYVNAGFDNRGANQYVVALMVEIGHHLFQLAFTHLAVANAHASLGNEQADLFGGLFDGFYFVVQVIHLSTAQQFSKNGFFLQCIIGLADESFYPPVQICRHDRG